MKNRLECLHRVYLCSPELPLPLFAAWKDRKLAFCKRCPDYWGHATGSKFQQKVNLLIGELGIHFTRHEEVKENLTPQDKSFLETNLKKTDNADAFLQFVHGLKTWVPESRQSCPT